MAPRPTIRFPTEIAKGTAMREKMLRKRRKMTQAELSTRSGVSLASIKRFVRTEAILCG